MDAMLVKVVVAGVLGAHGVGHVMGWMPVLGVARFEGVSSGSWLLSRPPPLGQPWWRPVAVASAATSLAASALYPQALPASSTVGSVAVDCLLLFGILVAGWGADTAAA